jgi:ubiquitin-conjugating enzyme E2 W
LYLLLAAVVGSRSYKSGNNLIKQSQSLMRIKGGEIVIVANDSTSKKKKKNKRVETTSLSKQIWTIVCRLLGIKTYKNNSLPTKSKTGKIDSKSSGVNGNTRIQKEIKSFLESPPDGCKLIVGSNIRSWIVSITGAPGTIYAGEEYKLKIIFPKDYPTKPPSVYFLKPCPRHQHVYTNGDICLNLLGKDWRPTMTAQMLAISILSMLSSAKEKKIPQDNAMHAEALPGQQQENWMYHDDKC